MHVEMPKNEAHRRALELWCGGMSQVNISTLVSRSLGVVRDVLSRYCKREIEYSKDGRSWWYRLIREIHPDAPISDRDRHRLWPSPPYDPYDDDDEAAIEVMNAADALNDALAHATADDRPTSMRIVDQRVYVFVGDRKTQ